MTWAIDLYYKRRADKSREDLLVDRIAQLRGRLDHREENIVPGAVANVCLTFEFEDQSTANVAARSLSESGEHIEGPYDYA